MTTTTATTTVHEIFGRFGFGFGFCFALCINNEIEWSAVIFPKSIPYRIDAIPCHRSSLSF
ncbi:hypothetical protein H8356DRAFT_1353159 [Neocallimastix lanati (nom. inval.)]|nr:hypothetical protein H8356DRAFT_1353159 [Neocallimastix sp. JGI-2020a]